MSEKVKIAVLVSGGGSNLQALLDARAAGGIPGGEIALVLSSNPEAYALTRAREAGIPTAVVERRGKKRETFTIRIMEILERYQIDLVVFAGFLYILHEDFFNAYENRAINVHPTLIPAFCGEGFYGMKMHEAALAYGVKLSGATVHFADAVTDGGPIILQKAVEVLPGDTPETLQRRIMEQGEWVLLPRAVALFCAGRLRVEGRRVTILPENSEVSK